MLDKLEQLNGKTIEEATTAFEDGVETVMITFSDGVVLKVYPSLGHGLGGYFHDPNLVPWWESHHK